MFLIRPLLNCVLAIALHTQVPLEPPAALGKAEIAATGQPEADPALLERCKLAAAYSDKHEGDAVLVMLNGSVIFERYHNGWSADRPHLLASGTKSFSGVAACLAIQDGLLTLDEPVSKTITEWQSDPRKAVITIRQLLSLCGGLESLSATIESARSAKAAGVEDRAEASINARLEADPGKKFIYGPSSFYVFGELMKRKLAAAKSGDVDVAAYIQRRIFEPLDISVLFMRDRAGNPNLPGGARTTARDWAAFGELLRLKGSWNGTQIINPDLLDTCWTAHGPNKSYGLTCWLLNQTSGNPEEGIAEQSIRGRLRERLRERNQQNATDSTVEEVEATKLGVMAAGKGKQRLYILPDHNMVVVRMGDINGGRRYEDREFLSLLLKPDASPRAEPSR